MEIIITKRGAGDDMATENKLKLCNLCEITESEHSGMDWKLLKPTVRWKMHGKKKNVKLCKSKLIKQNLKTLE